MDGRGAWSVLGVQQDESSRTGHLFCSGDIWLRISPLWIPPVMGLCFYGPKSLAFRIMQGPWVQCLPGPDLKGWWCGDGWKGVRMIVLSVEVLMSPDWWGNWSPSLSHPQIRTPQHTPPPLYSLTQGSPPNWTTHHSERTPRLSVWLMWLQTVCFRIMYYHL